MADIVAFMAVCKHWEAQLSKRRGYPELLNYKDGDDAVALLRSCERVTLGASGDITSINWGGWGLTGVSSHESNFSSCPFVRIIANPQCKKQNLPGEA